MNERIKELAEQAQQYAEHTTPQGLEWFDTFKEKFAELIVKECANMARVYRNHEFDFTGDLELDEFMLKHFGVE